MFCVAVIDSTAICPIASPSRGSAVDLLDIVTLTRYERVHQTLFF